MREQEQERAWKQLQAMRAREQQMQQMQHIVIHEQKGSGNLDPSIQQLQISTNAGNNDMIGPLASPSPNSRPGSGQFASPIVKGGRIIAGTTNAQQQQQQQMQQQQSSPQQTAGGFQHPQMSRPVSVQIPRPGQLQQRMGQSPFSPQTPQSPHDQFPLSPAQLGGQTAGVSVNDPFSRPPSENSQQDSYINVSLFNIVCIIHLLANQLYIFKYYDFILGFKTNSSKCNIVPNPIQFMRIANMVP